VAVVARVAPVKVARPRRERQEQASLSVYSIIYVDPAAKTVAAVLTNAAHGGGVANDITAPFYEAAGARPFQSAALELEKYATTTQVDPHAYVGQYESVALALRVIPYGDGIALLVRPKMRLYETNTLEESPPDQLRPMGDRRSCSRRCRHWPHRPPASRRAQVHGLQHPSQRFSRTL
jgi:hypothetical protein